MPSVILPECPADWILREQLDQDRQRPIPGVEDEPGVMDEIDTEQNGTENRERGQTP